MKFSSDRLISLRVRSGLSQVALARLAGLSKSYVCLVEQGKRYPSPPALDAFAAALQVKITDLMEPHIIRCPRCGHAIDCMQ